MHLPLQAYLSRTLCYFYLAILALYAGEAASLTYTVEVLDTQPHNPNSFTQGWIKHQDDFYESSGHYGRSFIQRYSDSPASTPATTASIPKRYFAEGLTLFNNTLYLLTWKEETLLLLDKNNLQIKQTLPYQGEGWGLTHNGEELIMSNGSDTLFFREPTHFKVTRHITVNLPLRLNELEYVNGIIWANSWYDDQLYAINSHNGCVLGTLDLAHLRAQTVTPNKRNVLNGIAYDKARNGLWVTGKYWPKRYLIRLPSITINNHSEC